MRWQGRRRSSNVEDRRGGGGGVARLGGGVGIGGIVVLLVGYFLGGDAASLLNLFVQQGGGGGASVTSGPGIDDEVREFIEVTLADTEEVWNAQFQKMGKRYQEPTLVLFENAAETACGYQQSAVGPFYCPGDNQVYLDVSFFRDLKARFGAGGDFAEAYVIAHEIGHHVQNLLGTSKEVHRKQQGMSKEGANDLSVRLELQADFYAGLFAHHANRMFKSLEDGDIEEALTAAEAIGDDRLQMQSRGYVVPESFTHGTSEQRQRWFRLGFQTGDIRSGDTFSARDL